MTAPQVTALPLSGGKAVSLGGITGLTVTASLSSPAVSMRCTAAAEQFPGDIGEISVAFEGRSLFSGRVDRQVCEISAAGRILQIEARSKGALLLDNEAVPCALSHAGLNTVFGLFAAPYGFTLEHPGTTPGLPLYVVNKGLSEWEALCNYTRRAYGRTPYMRGERVVVGLPRSVLPLVIGEGGYPYTALREEALPYHMLSKVVLRDENGSYTSAVHNSAAPYYGVQRKRYVIPQSEYGDALRLDANQRIKRSMLDSRRVYVTLPGCIDAEPGQEARVLGSALTLHNLMAESVTWRLDGQGLVTQLELIQSVYYE